MTEQRAISVTLEGNGEAAPTAWRASSRRPHRSEKRQLAIGAGSNAAVMAAKVALVFFVSPILVHKLGDARYGAWMFVNSITAYLLLGDFGVKNAVMRFVARHDGLDDAEGINRVFNTSLALMSAVGAALLALALLAGHFWGLPLKVPGNIRLETAHFFILQAILVAMLLPFSLPNALLAGLGEFPARNVISLLSLTLRQGVLVAVVWYGGGLVAIGSVLVAQCGLDFALSCLVARAYFPTLSCSLRYIDRETFRSIVGYGANVFVGDIAAMVIGQSACLIIGATLSSPDAITYFSIGASLKDYAVTILATVVLVLSPAVSKWQAMGREDSIRSAIAHAMRYLLYAALAVELGLLLLGYPFLSLWMGRTYADAGYSTLFILSLSIVCAAVNMVSARTLEGLGRVRPLACIVVVEAIATIGLGVPLTCRFGIQGIAAALSVTVTLAMLASILLTCRYLTINIGRLFLSACWAPAVAGACAAAIWLAAQHWFPIENWLTFLIVGCTGVIPFALVVVIAEKDVRGWVAGGLRAGAAKLISLAPVPPGWRFWRVRNRVLLVGYAADIPGGVTSVTRLLRAELLNLDLHVALYCFRPRWKAAMMWSWGLAIFVVRLASAPPRVVQIIIASHGDALRTLPYIALARLRGAKVCLHFHKNFAGIFAGYSPAVRELIFRAWRWAGNYCFLSERLRGEFSEFLAADKSWAIPNPIADEWLAAPLNPYRQRPKDLVFLGRWSAEKGSDYLLEFLAGAEDPAGARCEVYSDRGGGETRGNVVFHDWLADGQVQETLRQAKVLLLPSRAEAFPMVLIEAAACGTPFVASRIGGVEDMAEQSRAGLLHEVGDVEAMRQATHRLLQDRRLWEELSRNGRAWVESLAATKVAKQWKSLYAELGVEIVINSPNPGNVRCKSMDCPNLRIGVLNTGIASGNTGDFIIMDAALHQLEACLPLAQKIHFATHERLAATSFHLQRHIDFNVACGTNLLHSHMAIVKQWQIGLLASWRMKPVILLGVGWRSRAAWPTSLYTRWLLKSVLARDCIHSVRDFYTQQRLQEIGILNVVNTACPTMWSLTPDFCARIPAERGEDVVMTLTDYSPDPERDRQLIDLLGRAYRRVYFWCQGAGDYAYLAALGRLGAVEVIGSNLAAFDGLLADPSLALDYVGTRLHGGIRALQHARRTLIVGVDHRAEEKKHDFNLPVVSRYLASDALDQAVRSPMACEIHLPIESIRRWKEQFCSMGTTQEPRTLQHAIAVG